MGERTVAPAMPISIDEFERHDPDEGPTNAERVVRFLAGNADQAYRAAEIADATGVNENSVHPVLKRLRDRGLVRHRAPYWAIGDEDRVREAFAFHSAASHLDERLGTESREEWLAAAEAGPGGGGDSDDADGTDDSGHE